MPLGDRKNPFSMQHETVKESHPRDNVDAAEIAKFDALASRWWDPSGDFQPLHEINPLRLNWIREHVELPGKRIIDIGCGGGLLSEPMARLGADVTGIDAGERNVAVAALHAEQSGVQVTYKHVPPEELAGFEPPFDVVLNMEVVEHVADPAAFLTACRRLLRPGGLMVCSTINRNPKSYLLAIIGAEHIMRWLPKGTHDWSKFITPEELFELLGKAGLDPVDKKGFVFNPLAWTWSISDRDLSVNYVTACLKPS